MSTLFDMVEGSGAIRCPFTVDVYECSLDAGHDGEHRGHVSHDLSRAFVALGSESDG